MERESSNTDRLRLLPAVRIWAQVTPADYARSEGLREAWMYLTKDVADPARWIGDTSRFVYRKTVPGGFRFFVMDARTLRKAAGLRSGAARGGLSLGVGNHLIRRFDCPSRKSISRATDRHRVPPSSEPLEMQTVPTRLRRRALPAEPASRLRVVRDLSVSARQTPNALRRQIWEADVDDFNLVISAAGGGPVTILSREARPDDFYDPESIVRAPCSRSSPPTVCGPVIAAKSPTSNPPPRTSCSPRSAVGFTPSPATRWISSARLPLAPARQIAIDERSQSYQTSRLLGGRTARTLSFEYTSADTRSTA